MFNLLLLSIFMIVATWTIWLARIHLVSPASDRVRFEADLDGWDVRLVRFERVGVRSGRTVIHWVGGHAQVFFGGGYYRTYIATVAMPDGLTADYNVAVEAKLAGGLRSVKWIGRPG
jgi:hypothetical protein